MNSLMDLLLLLTAVCLLLGSTADAQSCSVDNIPTFMHLGERVRPNLPNQLQVIAPDYTFNCHGRVVRWGACFEPGGMASGREMYDIEFQVLRPSPASPGVTGYSVIGSNRAAERVASPPLNLDHCITFDVPVEDQFLVEPGDVVGFFSEHRNNGMNGGVQFDRRTDVTIFTVTSASYSATMFRVGSNNIIASTTAAAPVITAVIVMTSISQVVSSSAAVAPGTPPPISPELITPTTSQVVAPSPAPPPSTPVVGSQAPCGVATLDPPPSGGCGGSSVATSDPPPSGGCGGSSVATSDPPPSGGGGGSSVTTSDPPPSGGGDGGSSGTSTVAIIAGVVTGSCVLVLLIMIGVIIVCIRQRGQNSLLKTTMTTSERAVIVTEKNEAYGTHTNAGRPVVVTKRNEAYVTNVDVIPSARNEAYGVVGLEHMNSSNKEDTTDCTYETSHLSEEPPCDEYDYVR